METVGLVFLFMAFFGIFIFVLYNKYRIHQLIKYLGIFLENGSISRKQFHTLFESYTSFLGYIVWFPDASLYPTIYQNNAFTTFRKRSKIILISAGSFILLGFVGATILDSIK